MRTSEVWPLVAAVGVAVAWWLWLTPSAQARLSARRAPPVSSWLAGRSGALPGRTRALAGAAVGLSTWLWLGGAAWFVPVALVVAGAVGVGLGFVPSSATTRRREAVVAALPQACDLLAVCVEAGLPLRTALSAVADVMDGPLADRLGRIAARVGLGMAEHEAWDEAGREPGLEALGREVCRCLSSGATMGGVLRALAVEARRDALAAQEVRAKRTGVRCVFPLMVCFLPSFVLLGVVPIIGGVVVMLFQ